MNGVAWMSGFAIRAWILLQVDVTTPTERDPAVVHDSLGVVMRWPRIKGARGKRQCRCRSYERVIAPSITIYFRPQSSQHSLCAQDLLSTYLYPPHPLLHDTDVAYTPLPITFGHVLRPYAQLFTYTCYGGALSRLLVSSTP